MPEVILPWLSYNYSSLVFSVAWSGPTYYIWHILRTSRKFSSVVTNHAKGIEAIQEYHWLFESAPSFFVNGDDVLVLREPSEFYNTLKANIRVAKKRITLASLYLGTGPLEDGLVSSIRECLLQAVEKA